MRFFCVFTGQEGRRQARTKLRSFDEGMMARGRACFLLEQRRTVGDSRALPAASSLTAPSVVLCLSRHPSLLCTTKHTFPSSVPSLPVSACTQHVSDATFPVSESKPPLVLLAPLSTTQQRPTTQGAQSTTSKDTGLVSPRPRKTTPCCCYEARSICAAWAPRRSTISISSSLSTDPSSTARALGARPAAPRASAPK